MIHGDNRHGFAHGLGDFPNIFGIVFGDNKGLYAAPMSRKPLLFEPTNRKNTATQGDLSGHRHIMTNRNLSQSAHNRGYHRNPCGWSIFRERTFWEVNVDIHLLVEVR